MDEVQLGWVDVIEVRQMSPDHPRWPVLYPFNLQFRKARQRSDHAALSGSGVYLISKGDEVVYIGSYRPADGNIISDRWARHLETITGRGYRVGFGGENQSKRLDALTQAVNAQPLKDGIVQAFDEFRAERFRDTGYCTTPNRLRFASENWRDFGVADGSSIWRELEFRLFKIRSPENTRAGAVQVKEFEKAVLARFKPVCNREYVHQRHAQERSLSTLERVSQAVRNEAIIQTGSDFREMVRVSARA